ncbi:hypothetical protein C8F04DRAFT_1270570 [Mycena alexandri]|uniref:Uncharacterized protein n=1 Tax=Mycena alexandri TaxID=1745969 RepID=A0AAD6SAN8_9AGAR|nr:hypothetical protein C8F04DRAFT_1270570 [Mycena alexandri]
MPNPMKKALELFRLDFLALKEIVLAEANEIFNGTITEGEIVLVDATMHRRDTYVDGVLTKEYMIVAHSIEIISTADAVDAGFIDPSADLRDKLEVALHISE